MDWQKLIEQANQVLTGLGIPGIGALVVAVIVQILRITGIKVKADKLAFWLDLAVTIVKELEQAIKNGQINKAEAKAIAVAKLAVEMRRGFWWWLPWNRPKAETVERLVETAVNELPHK